MSQRFTTYAHATDFGIEDSQREDFLRALDKAADDGVSTTKFEAKFIGDFLAAPSRWIWTSPRRHVVDEMQHRYAHRIPGRLLTAGGSQRSEPTIPVAEAGACAYLVRNAELGRQTRCGQPATHKTPQGLELCEAHWNQRVEYLDRLHTMKHRRRS